VRSQQPVGQIADLTFEFADAGRERGSVRLCSFRVTGLSGVEAEADW